MCMCLIIWERTNIKLKLRIYKTLCFLHSYPNNHYNKIKISFVLETGFNRFRFILRSEGATPTVGLAMEPPNNYDLKRAKVFSAHQRIFSSIRSSGLHLLSSVSEFIKESSGSPTKTQSVFLLLWKPLSGVYSSLNQYFYILFIL